MAIIFYACKHYGCSRVLDAGRGEKIPENALKMKTPQ